MAKYKQAPKKVIARRVTGRVTWFNIQRGYGFAIRDDTKEDIFFHHSHIVWQTLKKKIRKGQQIKFNVVVGKKCNEALNVTSLNGKPLNCKRFPAKKRNGRKWNHHRRDNSRGRKAKGSRRPKHGREKSGGFRAGRKGGQRRVHRHRGRRDRPVNRTFVHFSRSNRRVFNAYNK